jgi:hypothetical protein
MASAGLVIEAATEREDIKRKIFDDVGKVLGHQAVSGNQHLVNPDHPHGAILTRSGAVYRRALLQSGSGDGPDRGHPGSRDV